MKLRYRFTRPTAKFLLRCLVPPLGITFLFGWLSHNEISLSQWLLAAVLLLMPWVSYLGWKRQSNDLLPLFSIISFVYWIFYAMSLFWGFRTVSGVDSPIDTQLSSQSVTTALGLTVLGMVCLWLGMKARLGGKLTPKRIPQLVGGTRRIHYIRLLLVLGTVMSLYEGLPFMLGEGSRQLLSTLASLLPILAFALLFRDYLRGECSPLDKIMVVGFFLLRFIIGISSGWLGSFAAIIVICGAIYISERKKIPRSVGILVLAFTLFFQVGKKEFRNAYWYGANQGSKIERVYFWMEASMNRWSEAFADPTGSALNEALNESLARVSLLTQTANVVDLTPSVVPYQGAQLYSYMAVTWIPRALWPNKPSVNESNRFYQVAYGLSDEEGLEGVSIGVGVMTESYISFGWLGVICIMFLMGVFYDIYQKTFFAKTSGALMFGIGVALLPQMLVIEAQMAPYLGGIVQQVVLTLIIFLPVIRLTPKLKPYTAGNLALPVAQEDQPATSNI